MNQKKAFSYLMWFLYSMVVCVSLLSVASSLSQQAGYSDIIGYGVAVLWLIICGLIVLLIHKLVDDVLNMDFAGQMPALVAEGLIVVAILVVGIVLRVLGLPDGGDTSGYYELTKVVEGQTITPAVHGVVHIYQQLLHLVYVLLGNKFVAGIWLQIILQAIAGLFVYRAVRKLTGVISSVVALGFLMFGPLMIDEALILSPEMLFLLIYGIALYACACCIRGKKGPVACLFTGLAIAVVCCLDIMGIALLFMTVLGLLYAKSDGDRPLSGRLIGALVCIISCGVGFALLILINSLLNGMEFADVLATWWRLFSPADFEMPAMLDVLNPTVDILCLLLVMTLGMFSFWCCYDCERQSIWIWLAAFQVVIQCFGMTTAELSGHLNLYIAFAILAGTGIASMFAPEELLEEDEEEPVSVSKAPETEEKPPVVKKVIREPGSENAKPKSVVIRIPANPGEKPVAKESIQTPVEQSVPKEQPVPVAETPENVKEEPPKVKLIENPLPLPKKHVKKTLDFDVDLDKGQDDFDFDVADDDDYDI